MTHVSKTYHSLHLEQIGGLEQDLGQFLEVIPLRMDRG